MMNPVRTSAPPPEPGSAQEAKSQTHLTGTQFSRLQRKAESGDAEAELKLAGAYHLGEGVVPQDQTLAANWYRKAAEQGNAEAQNSLGMMYRTGDGVDRDKDKALKWYRLAAAQNNANAMFNLGTAYYNGDGVEISDAAAYAWFLLAKQAGSMKAAEAVARSEAELKPHEILNGLREIAKIYETGNVLKKNEAEAARYWLQLAQKGDQDAKITIASGI